GHVGLGVAGPYDPELAYFPSQRFNARQVVGQGIVVKKELLNLRESRSGPSKLLDYVTDATCSVMMTADSLRPKAKCTARFEPAGCIERDVWLPQIPAKIVLNDEVALVDGGNERQIIHTLQDGTILVMHDSAVGPPPRKSGDASQIATFRDFLDREIELVARNEVDGRRGLQAQFWLHGDLRADHANFQTRVECFERFDRLNIGSK